MCNCRRLVAFYVIFFSIRVNAALLFRCRVQMQPGSKVWRKTTKPFTEVSPVINFDVEKSVVDGCGCWESLLIHHNSLLVICQIDWIFISATFSVHIPG